ncbi:hypothetical protein DFA_01231 [Cavenderia fasciculata]|uniref:Ankyrin repeat-containing protein n=1 Tax=Cavenderia fasciculata TaxID=261658 RepID=F4PRL0_CACFS|nr:uncharacterized protein DFA_01231 [Cavenderia fasciculata]EGG21350.1 hypothetical protein DFA_01231 [Cavenderia fasciculata]|eukprot:XP_004359200.1 hypothetical protein DFA_01231 [Cavenderia fasciculata]
MITLPSSSSSIESVLKNRYLLHYILNQSVVNKRLEVHNCFAPKKKVKTLYYQWTSIDDIIGVGGYLGLLKDKLVDPSRRGLIITSQSISLLVSHGDEVLFNILYNNAQYRYWFNQNDILYDAIAGGNVSILNTLMQQEDPVQMRLGDMERAFVAAAHGGHTDMLNKIFVLNSTCDKRCDNPLNAFKAALEHKYRPDLISFFLVRFANKVPVWINVLKDELHKFLWSFDIKVVELLVQKFGIPLTAASVAMAVKNETFGDDETDRLDSINLFLANVYTRHLQQSDRRRVDDDPVKLIGLFGNKARARHSPSVLSRHVIAKLVFCHLCKLVEKSCRGNVFAFMMQATCKTRIEQEELMASDGVGMITYLFKSDDTENMTLGDDDGGKSVMSSICQFGNVAQILEANKYSSSGIDYQALVNRPGQPKNQSNARTLQVWKVLMNTSIFSNQIPKSPEQCAEMFEFLVDSLGITEELTFSPGDHNAYSFLMLAISTYNEQHVRLALKCTGSTNVDIFSLPDFKGIDLFWYERLVSQGLLMQSQDISDHIYPPSYYPSSSGQSDRPKVVPVRLFLDSIETSDTKVLKRLLNIDQPAHMGPTTPIISHNAMEMIIAHYWDTKSIADRFLERPHPSIYQTLKHMIYQHETERKEILIAQGIEEENEWEEGEDRWTRISRYMINKAYNEIKVFAFQFLVEQDLDLKQYFINTKKDEDLVVEMMNRQQGDYQSFAIYLHNCKIYGNHSKTKYIKYNLSHERVQTKIENDRKKKR